ncbi:aspartyl/asparaginyl beta-hydroxylase domain-containing protein [Nostoc sp. FACHB-152]|uniref:aspartyl/asparaginyl beta-hydroxylase domain-containing protein n=1 Tax=unclassified Nostoc TaxID=2593658 RepID=UPI00168216CC|nr:aspartyl/asparaginyl beta-hydroxylase domain-containing protein [Nostoc sp. FACHB-152]MBD2469133.1 aspartyl/asparaginyl beta-hydroxylase domain-containing protein [Nostoc sp. FACHB-145]
MCPKTWKLWQQIPGLKVAFFFILSPRKHIPKHRGQHQGLIRYHLELIIPELESACRIRIGNEIACWKEGKMTRRSRSVIPRHCERGSKLRVASRREDIGAAIAYLFLIFNYIICLICQ